MTEAYFEEQKPAAGGILYPFSCHLQEGMGRGIIAPAHWQYYIEILYCLEGKVKVLLGGESYNFTVGDMVLINSREVHSVSADEEGEVRYIVLKFDPEVLYTTSKTIFESKYVLPFTMTKSTHQKLFTRHELKDTSIPALLQEILHEYRQKSYGFELAIRTHICRIFLWILRSWKEKGLDLNIDYALKESDIQRLQKVFDYLDENYQNDITVKSVSRLCSMSYSYFSKYFKAAIGKTFTEYVNYVRITEAEKLLHTTDLNITEIAQKTGFSTSSYFIQQFRHYKNISPKQFRKKLHRPGGD